MVLKGGATLPNGGWGHSGPCHSSRIPDPRLSLCRFSAQVEDVARLARRLYLFLRWHSAKPRLIFSETCSFLAVLHLLAVLHVLADLMLLRASHRKTSTGPRSGQAFVSGVVSVRKNAFRWILTSSVEFLELPSQMGLSALRFCRVFDLGKNTHKPYLCLSGTGPGPGPRPVP